MPNYRRAFIPGGCWFFTVNLLERRRTLLVDHIDSPRESIAKTRRKYPFEINAFVVLPNHLHAIWTLPPGDADFSTRWRLIKTAFAKSLPKQERLSAVRKARNERGIWQPVAWVERSETRDRTIRKTPGFRSAQAGLRTTCSSDSQPVARRVD
jgi:putative transposase